MHRAPAKWQTLAAEHSQVYVHADWCCECVCLPVCTVHIGTCVFVCEIECKLVVSCHPWCGLMAYRQVIYDLSVAGRKEGDTRLSLQINKRCSGAHIISPLHVCERTNLAPALFFIYLLSSQTAHSFLLVL